LRKDGGVQNFLEGNVRKELEELPGINSVEIIERSGNQSQNTSGLAGRMERRRIYDPVDLVGTLYDLRRYRIGNKVRATTGGKVSLIGKKGKSNLIWLCEGEWDGMALYESLKEVGSKDSVFAVTGGVAFPQHAIPEFEGKNVYVCFDNDETGRKGSQRVKKMLTGVAKNMKFVHWPADLPDKFDVRDFFLKKRKRTSILLKKLLKDVPPVPADGIGEDDSEQEAALDGKGLSWKKVVEVYREHLYLPDDKVIQIMYGAVLANRLDGDPIWLFLIAPPGGTKTELLISLNEAPLTISTTTLTPRALISGASNTGGADPSLIPKLDGKVLIVKDFTTILDMPQVQRDEIFGILRDAYDGKCEKYWGTGLHRTYYSNFGIIGGVTPMIEMFGASSSMLGERFLKYRLPHSGNLQTGEAIIDAALSNIGKESNMRKELQKISHEALNFKVDPHNPPKLSEEMKKRFILLAQWVSILRGVVRRERYTQKMEFKPTQEIGTRIAKQLARLAMGISIFRKEEEVSEESYKITTLVAKSTAPDKVEEIVKQLYLRSKTDFCSTKDLAKWAGFDSGTVRDLLIDLQLLKIVVRDSQTVGMGKWRLSRTVLRMMNQLYLYDREEEWINQKTNITKKKKTKLSKTIEKLKQKRKNRNKTRIRKKG